MATATADPVRRPLAVAAPAANPLPLRLVALVGQEGISQLFRFQLTLAAESRADIPFEGLLGQKVTVRLDPPADPDAAGGSGPPARHFAGICSRLSRGESDFQGFTTYGMDLVPQFWLLSRRAQSRVFQHLSVPDILKEVLGGLDVSYELQGTFHAREFCVQYRETDFNFASRLMEEEGIFYFFKHSAAGHQMVLANTPLSHPDVLPPSTVTYEDVRGGFRRPEGVYDWEKIQELRSGKYTLWDHCFELPGQHLEATKTTLASVQVGEVTHPLRVGGNDRLEIYDYPGEYAQRFDGVDRGGGENARELRNIFQDNVRTAEIRMQQEAAAALVVRGAGNCRHFAAGHKFTLTTEDPRARLLQADGQYVLTGVAHSARSAAAERSGQGSSFAYQNSFTCIPLGLPYRPPRTTPKPAVQGTQTAVVVGPAGEEIFCDRHGRVKVQFHWDRQGRHDADSSCWVRVGTVWAGQRWGAVHIPRVGQEVIVAFEEGDPDQPIIIGSVYNAEMVPPYPLPEKRTQSGIKTRSTAGGGADNFNELRFEDKKGGEDVYFHAEKDFHRVVENDDDLKVGHDQTVEVKNHRTETIREGNETVTVEKGDRSVTVAQGKDLHTVRADRTVIVEQGKDVLDVKQGDREVKVEMGKDILHISAGDQETRIDLGKSTTEAMQSIELKVGQSSIKLDPAGVTIKGLQVKVEGSIQAELKGAMATVKGDGVLTLKGGLTLIN